MKTLLTICAFLCTIFAISGEEKKVVCYWNSISQNNDGLRGLFKVEDIDPTICTHIIYTYIRFSATLLINDDYNKDVLQKFINLKILNPNVKLLIGVGGPRQGSQIPSQIARTATGRNDFATKVKSFIDEFGFDGCDIDWQWPGQGIGTTSEDKGNYVLLLEKFREVLTNRKILSISVAPKPEDIEKSYDITSIIKYVDIINLNIYNFHGFNGENVTAFHSPYRKNPDDTSNQAEWNTESIVRNWLSKGCPAELLTLGIPAYGRSFTLSDINQTGVGAPVNGIGKKSDYSLEKNNIIPYIEICTNLKSNPKWIDYFETVQFGSYAVYAGDQWVGFDDMRVHRSKIHFALNMELAGLNYATIDRDDFHGDCSGNKFPLIKIGYDAIVNGILPTDPLETTTTSTTSTPTTTSSSTTDTPTTTSSSTTDTPTTTSSSTTNTPTTTSSSTTNTPTTTTPRVTVTKDPDEDTRPTTSSSTISSSSTTSSRTSTTSRSTTKRLTTTRTTTSEIPTPVVTPNGTSARSGTSTSSTNTGDRNTPPNTTIKTSTTTKKLSTTNNFPTPPVTPNSRN